MVKPDTLELRCARILGGNASAEQSLALPGIDAHLSAIAHSDADGGDIHYVSTCGQGEIVRFLVADVAGHGVAVSDLAARFRGLVSKHLNRLDQRSLARDLNAALLAGHHGGRFVTALLASYHRPSGMLLLCNAGHPRPLLYRAESSRWRLLDGPQGNAGDRPLNPPLGIADDAVFEQHWVALMPGDRIVLYTDGLCERRDRVGQAAETAMLVAASAIGEGNPACVAKRLREALGATHRRPARADDETVLVFAPNGAPFRPPSWSERLHALRVMLGFPLEGNPAQGAPCHPSP